MRSLTAESNTLYHPDTNIPRQVTWLLGRHNRKHTHEFGKPSLKLFGKHLSAFTNRLHWSNHLSKSPGNPWYRLKPRTMAKPCSRLVDPELRAWTARLEHHLNMMALEARRLFSPPRHILLRHALGVLRQSVWRPELSDKDSGFVLVHRDHRDSFVASGLKRENYGMIAWHNRHIPPIVSAITARSKPFTRSLRMIVLPAHSTVRRASLSPRSCSRSNRTNYPARSNHVYYILAPAIF